MVDPEETNFEQPANEAASVPDTKLPDIVAFELRRHGADHAHTDEIVAARAESFLDLLRAFFARKA
jgi:hypothetical protein